MRNSILYIEFIGDVQQNTHVFKNKSEGVNQLVKLLLEACNFTKKELFHSYFSRTLS